MAKLSYLGWIVTTRNCKQCGRPWMVTMESPCDCPPEDADGGGVRCIDRAVFGHHTDSEFDVVEVVARSCPHGTEYDQLCKGCGAWVGGWGVGAAGFLETCGCKIDEVKSS